MITQLSNETTQELEQMDVDTHDWDITEKTKENPDLIID